MKRPTKYVKPLTDEQRERLKQIMRTDPTHRRRMRAHSVLLSDRKYSLDQIADIYQVDRDRVSQWFEWWEEEGEAGLDDDPRSGRPPKLSDEEKKKVVELIEEEPRSTRRVVSQIADLCQQTISPDTVRRIFDDAGLIWKRMRRSLRSFRDPVAFAAAKTELAHFRKVCAEDNAEMDLWYFDEAGFTLTPTVPYGWQRLGETRELASPSHRQRQNVLGFLNLHNGFHSFAFEDRIDTDIVIACFNEFRRQLTKPAMVVIDNASIHTSNDFQDAVDDWREQGLYLYFLPSYSPELNLIENLWRHIKYRWLPLDASHSFQHLTESLFSVLAQIGSKYRITFA